MDGMEINTNIGMDNISIKVCFFINKLCLFLCNAVDIYFFDL